MNLREFCQLPNLPFAILTTYNIDPLFFERVVLSDLVQGGATRILILADADQALAAVAQVKGQLLALGRRYRLIPMRGKGSFHPKLCLRLGSAGAVVACGSHNLTRSGWLGCRKTDNSGGNREATVTWQVIPESYSAGQLAVAVRTLAALAENAADRDDILAMLPSTWPDKSGAAAEAWSWEVFGSDRTLASQLAVRWRGRRFDKIRFTCGSTDGRGAMLRWAADTFGVTEATVELDLACCGFDPRQLADLPLRLRIVPYDGQPRTHLKAVLLESSTDCAAVIGSANCSGAAWLRRSAEAGNIESAVIFDHCNPADVAHLFRSGVGEARPWEQVVLTSPVQPEQPEFERPDHRLRQLQLHRAVGELTAVVDARIPNDAMVFAVTQKSRVPLRRTTVSDQYRGPMPDLTEGPETLFGHVEWDTESRTERTNDIWIDDVDRLNEAAGRHHRFDSVRKLSSMGISADYKRLLEDIHVLSQTLLTGPDAFPDGAKREPKQEQSEATKPAKMLSASDVVRTLDQLTQPHLNSHSSSAFGGSISLTGIMRLLFLEAVDGGAEIDATAAEHQRSNEERETEQNEQQNQSNEDDKGEDGPTDTQRRRLLEQLRQFLDKLAEPGFASKCSARQLQQAAAFPLAIAKFASRGPWVQESELGLLSQAIQRTCELLFFRNYVELNPKTKVSQKRRPLLEEVRERYAVEQRAEDFDQIIGDGTLWLVLLGSLTLFGGMNEDAFSRNLILRDIAQYPSLLNGIIPEQLAALARRISVEGTVDPLLLAKVAVERFDLMEWYLSQSVEEFKKRCERAEVTVGDWLWNTGVGFAQVLELQDGRKAKVHVRKRADTLSNVNLSYYVNLRVLAEGDTDFHDLYKSCCSA